MMVSMLFVLGGCASTDKSIALKCENGAEVNLLFHMNDRWHFDVKDSSCVVELSEGTVTCSLITNSDALTLQMSNYDNDSYMEFTMNDADGFGYEDDMLHHILYVDENTCLQLDSENQDALFAVEAGLTFNSMSVGKGNVDEFSSQVSQYGVPEEDEGEPVTNLNPDVDGEASTTTDEEMDDNLSVEFEDDDMLSTSPINP